MSYESRQLHKETATAILTGIAINFPLNFMLLYLWLDILYWDSALKIAVCNTAIMTVVAYTRIAGCILALTLPANFGMWLFVWAFLIAEGIGIAEEF